MHRGERGGGRAGGCGPPRGVRRGGPAGALIAQGASRPSLPPNRRSNGRGSGFLPSPRLRLPGRCGRSGSLERIALSSASPISGTTRPDRGRSSSRFTAANAPSTNAWRRQALRGPSSHRWLRDRPVPAGTRLLVPPLHLTRGFIVRDTLARLDLPAAPLDLLKDVDRSTTSSNDASPGISWTARRTRSRTVGAGMAGIVGMLKHTAATRPVPPPPRRCP